MVKFMRENLTTVLDFLNQIIGAPAQCESKVYLEAFAAANHWCNHARSTFVPHDGFITNVFALLNAEPGQALIHGTDMSLKVIKIVKKLLNKSKHAKILEEATLEQAVKMIPQKDMAFLELVIAYLHKNRERFLLCIQIDPSNDDEELD
jgi:hypothetical protein